MRLRRLIVAVAITALTFPIFPPSIAAGRALPGPCHLHRGEDETVQHFAKRNIRCAVRRLGPVPGGVLRAICIARRESGLFPRASSATGMYRGLFQHAWEYWAWRYETFTEVEWELPERVYSARTNAIVTVRMVDSYGTWGSAGWAVRDCR